MRTQKRSSSAQLNSAFQAFVYRCSIITLIPKSEISCLQLFSVAVCVGPGRKTTKTGFSRERVQMTSSLLIMQTKHLQI